MRFDEIVKRVSEVVPRFNNYALKDFVEKSINDSPEFLALVFREGCKIIPADLHLMGYDIMSPEERVKFELRPHTGKPTRVRVPLTISHLRLVRFKIKFGDEIVESRLYTPYLFHGMFHVKGKRSIPRNVILEQTFSRLKDKDKDGLSISPIRINIPFNRKRYHRVTSYTTGLQYAHFIVTAKLFNGVRKLKIADITIMHYMLAKFGFRGALKKFSLSKTDIDFAAEVGDDTDRYEYFSATMDTDPNTQVPTLFLKVKKTILADDQSCKFVVNLLYVLDKFSVQNISNVYDENASVWKIILGTITFEDRAELKALSNAETNLKSVDTFIDPLTRDRVCKFGIPINDIYDVLIYVFKNIDTYMVNNLAQDLYSSRIDVSNGILVETYGKKIIWDVYALAKRTNITLRDVKSTFSFHPMLFRMTASGKGDDAEHYSGPPEIIGDNLLLAGGLIKIRLGGRPEQRLHPSMLVAESVSAIVGKYIGKTGFINPYIPTDERGAIIKPDYAEDIDPLIKYLPR